ncbi:MAG: hypothetical protein ACOX56_03550 [Acholeplasmataceae bacterium]|jgi:hypothetical protein
MNPTNAKRYSIISIVLSGAAIVLSLILIIILTGLVIKHSNALQQYEVTGVLPEDFLIGVLTTSSIFTAFLAPIGIAYLVFYILSIVEASKITESKTVFILLLVGIGVNVVALVGLIMLLAESLKESKKQAETAKLTPEEINAEIV